MNILFVHNGLRSFVRADLKILQSEHTVREFNFSKIKTRISEIYQNVRWCDIVFGWWATWHMLLPVLFASQTNKPIIVVGGDYDVIFEKKFRSQKRILMDKARKFLGRYLFPRIDRFITFSEFSREQTLKLPYVIPSRVIRIYCGLEDIAQQKIHTKENLVLSVGTIHQYDVYRKGYLTFVQSASYLPEFQFQLVGAWEDKSVELLRKLNNDVSYPGYLPDQALFQAMSDSKVYVQVSHHEGFGMALAEAMLFQCVPVVTNRGSIPEIVGDCGFYVPYGDPEETAMAIRTASEQSKCLGLCARERILTEFPIEKRKQELFGVIRQLCEEKIR